MTVLAVLSQAVSLTLMWRIWKRRTAEIPDCAHERRAQCSRVDLLDGQHGNQRRTWAGAAPLRTLSGICPRASRVVTPYPRAYALSVPAPAEGGDNNWKGTEASER